MGETSEVSKRKIERKAKTELESRSFREGAIYLFKRADYVKPTWFCRVKLSLMKLFDEWTNHPEQQEQAKRTVSSYRAVFKALDQFLKHPEAPSVTIEDIRRYTDHRMYPAR